MFKNYKRWLYNAPIAKKFIPKQIITILMFIIMGSVSLMSVFTLNNMSQVIFTKNVEKTEQLNEIVQTMYRCRVLGRDILLQEDPTTQLELYGQYIVAFDTLDSQMDTFATRLTDDKLETFNAIIEQKNIYKESMILSSDIRIQGGAYEDALEALTRVTPIANEFFGSIDTFLTEEKLLMQQAMDTNDDVVVIVLIVVIATNILGVLVIYFMTKTFANTLTSSLVNLEQSVSRMTKIENMKSPIPEELFTKDEIGLIAKVVDNLRKMLLDYSFKDILTGGYNTTAYHEELSDIFAKDLEEGEQHRFWCLIFDMNNLKNINDNLGHIEGDSTIKSTQQILSSSFGEKGKVFRIGGDEFVVLASDLDEQEIKTIVKNIQELIAEANINKSQKFSVACGYDEFIGRTREEFEHHFKIVDKKMYQNKNKIKGLRNRPISIISDKEQEA